MKRRVVVTGIGAVSPLGCSIPHIWASLMKKESATTSLIFPSEHHNFPSKVAARVPREETHSSPFLPDNSMSSAEQKKFPMFIQYAIGATSSALSDAGLSHLESSDTDRYGVAVGTGIGSLDTITETSETLEKDGLRRISPYFVPSILQNMAAGQISLKYRFRGPSHSVTTACSTGANAIGDAFRFIQDDYADVFIAGGTEASINPLSIAGFSRCKALSKNFNDCPWKASRPFDSKRDGFVIGEGSAIFILEELEHALRRNAKIYAEIVGYGLSSDAYHVTQPDPSGSGAKRSMKSAMRSFPIEKLGYINAHATSTPLGDGIEAKAIHQLASESTEKGLIVHVSSTKGALGHLLGAAGSIEAAITVLAIKNKLIPPNVNLDNVDIGFDGWEDRISFPKDPVPKDLEFAMTNSFGFGGTNVSLLFKAFKS